MSGQKMKQTKTQNNTHTTVKRSNKTSCQTHHSHITRYKIFKSYNHRNRSRKHVGPVRNPDFLDGAIEHLVEPETQSVEQLVHRLVLQVRVGRVPVPEADRPRQLALPLRPRHRVLGVVDVEVLAVAVDCQHRPQAVADVDVVQPMFEVEAALQQVLVPADVELEPQERERQGTVPG